MSTETKEETYTLTQLNNRFKKWVDKNVGHHKFWVECEIAKANLNGVHWYLELVDSDAQEQTTAKARGNIWRSTAEQISHSLRAFGVKSDEIIKEGNRVRIQCSFQYNSIYGLSLVINGIDPSTTLGDIEKQKQQTLKRLTDEGLIDLQKQLYLSPLARRIALVGSPGTSGFEDFVKELTNNTIYSRFKFKAFPTTVQGDVAVNQIVAAIKAASEHDVDAIVLVRGGGSKMDLHVFNHYNVCSAIAYSRIPVITGVGHESDNCLVDTVAYEARKTPTAAAKRFYISIGTFSAALTDSMTKILGASKNTIHERNRELDHYKERLVQDVSRRISSERDFIGKHELQFNQTINVLVKSTKQLIDNYGKQITLLSSNRIKAADHSLKNTSDLLIQTVMNIISEEKQRLKGDAQRTTQGAFDSIGSGKKEQMTVRDLFLVRLKNHLSLIKNELNYEGQKLLAIDPTRLFSAGYTISTIDGQDLNKATGELINKLLITYSDNYHIESRITKTEKR